MSRLLTFLSRTPRVLYALWLVVAMTQPTGAHACPVHDRALMAAMQAHGMVMHHDEHESPAPGEHSHGHCHCLGDCSAGGAPPLAPARTTIPAPAAVLASTPVVVTVERPFEQPERRLPPATAPPSALAA